MAIYHYQILLVVSIQSHAGQLKGVAAVLVVNAVHPMQDIHNFVVSVKRCSLAVMLYMSNGCAVAYLLLGPECYCW